MSLVLGAVYGGMGTLNGQCDDIAQVYHDKACCGDDSMVGQCVSPDVSAKIGSLVAGGGAPSLVPASEVATIKSSSLSYANSAGRVGFDYQFFYNDFTNEGHMYPVHGVGDLDETAELMSRFIKSAQGEAFDNTDLGVKIQVTDPALTNDHCFFDFHTIPTKLLDGSSKLPDGSRIESHIPYFTKKDHDNDPCRAKVDWINGDAVFFDKVACRAAQKTSTLPERVPTSLSSTRVTPFLEDKEHLALTFFQDGKQSRLTNGGNVSNWRYVVPYSQGKPIGWFVAKAYRPCQNDGTTCMNIVSTSGDSVSVQPRKSSETEDLDSIASEPRYMKTVSEVVEINAVTRAAAFNQRYGNKAVDFGDVIMKDTPTGAVTDPAIAAKLAAKYTKHADDKQIAFYEMLKVLKTDLLGSVYPYSTAALPEAVETTLQEFISVYLNTALYNISPKALVTKALMAPEYMQSPIGETGWLVVENDKELPVPDDGGEYFIGWVIETQPMFEASSNDPMLERSLVPREKLQWLVTHGYALHQGPGLLYETCGDFAHVGTQEPYILSHNYAAQQMDGEDAAAFASRKKSQAPRVHWRLDAPSTIKKSLTMGAVTEANVGAGQMALVSIGTQTPVNKPSRSKNFLGEAGNYQKLLANPTMIQGLVGVNDPDQPYTIVAPGNTFGYGTAQQISSDNSYG